MLRRGGKIAGSIFFILCLVVAFLLSATPFAGRIQAAAPSVTTNAATGITNSSATLNGKLNSLGGAPSVNVSFEYGLTNSYGKTTPVKVMAATGNFSAPIGSLFPGMVWHFRAKVDAGAQGIAYGSDLIFTTTTNNVPYGLAKFAFISARDGNEEVYAVTPDNMYLARLTDNMAKEAWPRFLADFSKVTFTSWRDGNAEVYVMNPDGTGQTRLTSNPGFDGMSDFSWDGSKIVFVSDRDGSYGIYVMNADGSNQVRLASSLASDIMPAFSPDGTKIAFASNRDGNYEIYVINAGGSNPVRLTSNSVADYYPSWLNTGAKLAFSSWRDGNGEIYVMDANGSNVSRLTNDAATDDQPAWCPTGGAIFFTSWRYGNIPQIIFMWPDGTHQTQFTTNPQGNWSRANWTPPVATSPVVVTTAATSITTATATLNGNLSSPGVSTPVQVSFQWGLTTSYGKSTAIQTRTTTGPFSAAISGLAPNTTYHFRAKATAGTAVVYGSDQSFKTGVPPPPAVEEGGGGGGGIPGYIYVGGYLSWDGTLAADFEASSTDGKARIRIPKETKFTRAGYPGSTMYIFQLAKQDQPPQAMGSIIGMAYEFGPGGSTFEPEATVMFNYDESIIPQGIDEKDVSIAFWDSQLKKWTKLEKYTVNPFINTISGQIAHFSIYALVIPDPAAFKVSNLSISPVETDTGKEVTISAQVSNAGELAANYTAALKISGKPVETKNITLAGGASEAVKFTVSQNTSGTYSVDLNGLSGSFMVRAPAPAAFEVSDFSISPAEVDVGKEVTISARVTNTGQLSGTYAAVLKINDTVVETSSLTLAGGANEQLIFKISRNTDGTCNINLDKLSGAFTVKASPQASPQAAALFKVSSLSISPAEVDTGKAVTISAQVTNTSQSLGTFTANLKVNGTLVTARSINLAGGASQSVTFNVTRDARGTYSVSIEDLSGSFLVKSPSALTISWWLVAGLAVAALIVIIALVSLIRKRSKRAFLNL